MAMGMTASAPGYERRPIEALPILATESSVHLFAYLIVPVLFFGIRLHSNADSNIPRLFSTV